MELSSRTKLTVWATFQFVPSTRRSLILFRKQHASASLWSLTRPPSHVSQFRFYTNVLWRDDDVDWLTQFADFFSYVIFLTYMPTLFLSRTFAGATISPTAACVKIESNGRLNASAFLVSAKGKTLLLLLVWRLKAEISTDLSSEYN